ncbi:MAG: type IV pilus biogenesis protein PilP [Propionivibrio sp.]
MSPQAWAQQSPAEQVKQINEEIAVLSARLQKLDMEAKIAAKEAEKSRSLGSLSLPSALDTAKSSSELPVVRAIEGIDGKLSAKLITRGGLEQTVREGEKIGVWTIKAITVNSVVIAHGNESTRLAFGNEPPAETSGRASGGVGLPGLPPVGQPR